MTYKIKNMQKILNIMAAASFLLITAACGDSAKDKKGDISDLKAKLEKKKKEKNDIDAEVRQLEDQIAKAEPDSAKLAQKLVSVTMLQPGDFTHYIDLQGRIDANDIVYVAPRGQAGQVKGLYIKKGDIVKQGQLLVKLDDAVMLQQVDGLKTQLAYAENIYNRQKNLWDQGIGTEVQVITAKNNVDNLNKQIANLTENWKTSFIYAPISGVADEVNVKEGELFMGAGQIKLVNTSDLKVITEVPENYVARVKKGDTVRISVPETGRPEFKSTISVIGSTINANSRAFATEAKLPSDPLLKPNQLAKLRIKDYETKKTIVVPVNIVQTDEKGKYVYVMEKSGNKYVTKKKPVTTGESYEGMVEIKSGLAAGEPIITEGYQN
ncbi:MAG: efflux RND transporter periplasmic adaptor subunit, partial [Bacteroidota bacterium]|nr:efflux RND transporter periplasmic adaptor subunit [Bacteroidota bacterium]